MKTGVLFPQGGGEKSQVQTLSASQLPEASKSLEHLLRTCIFPEMTVIC